MHDEETTGSKQNKIEMYDDEAARTKSRSITKKQPEQNRDVCIMKMQPDQDRDVLYYEEEARTKSRWFTKKQSEQHRDLIQPRKNTDGNKNAMFMYTRIDMKGVMVFAESHRLTSKDIDYLGYRADNVFWLITQQKLLNSGHIQRRQLGKLE